MRSSARSRMAAAPKARSNSRRSLRSPANVARAKSKEARDAAKPKHKAWRLAIAAKIKAGEHGLIPNDLLFVAEGLLNVPTTNLGYCYQGLNYLAAEIGLCPTQVSRRLKLFEAARLLKRCRTQSTNFYVLCIDGKPLFPDGQLIFDLDNPDRTSMSDPDRTSMSDPDRTSMSDPDRTSMSDKLSSESELPSDQAIIGVEPPPPTPPAAPSGEREEGEEGKISQCDFEVQASRPATPPPPTEPEQAENSASGLSKEVLHASDGAPPLDGEVLRRTHEPRFTDVWNFHPVGYEGAATKRWNDLTPEERIQFWLWLLLENMRAPLRRFLANPTPLAVLLDSPRWREESPEEVIATLRERWAAQQAYDAERQAERAAADAERRKTQKDRAEAKQRCAEREQQRIREQEAQHARETADCEQKLKEIDAMIISEGIETAKQHVVSWQLNSRLRAELEKRGVLGKSFASKWDNVGAAAQRSTSKIGAS